MSTNEEYYERLRRGEVLPTFHKELRVDDYMKPEEKQKRIDERTDILANILAAYPTTPTSQLAKEYGLSVDFIYQLATNHGVRKAGNSEQRTAPRKVEKVDSTGKVVATYRSANEACKAEGIKYSLLRRRLDGSVTSPIDGFTYRLGEQKPAAKAKRFDFNFDVDFDNDELDLEDYEF